MEDGHRSTSFIIENNTSDEIKVEARDEGFTDGSESAPSPSLSVTSSFCSSSSTSTAALSTTLASSFTSSSTYPTRLAEVIEKSDTSRSIIKSHLLNVNSTTSPELSCYTLSNITCSPQYSRSVSIHNNNGYDVDNCHESRSKSRQDYRYDIAEVPYPLLQPIGDKPYSYALNVDCALYDDNNNKDNKNDDDLENCCTRIDSLLQQQQHDQLREELQHQQSRSDDSGRRRCCSCVIDVSTPATLERDFYAWLNQSEIENDELSTSCPCKPSVSESYCSSLDIYTASSLYYSSFNSPEVAARNDDFLGYDVGGFQSLNCLPDSFFDTIPHSTPASNSSSSVSPASANSSRERADSFVSVAFPSLMTSNRSSAPESNVVPKMPQTRRLTSSHSMPTPSVPFTAAKSQSHIIKKSKAEKGLQRGTNLYGRPYCPGRPLSMEERAQIINLFHGGMKVNAISKRLCISHGCVSKIITRFRETGLLIPSSHSECRRRKRLLAAAQQQEHHHQQQIMLQQQQLQHQQLLQQQKQFLLQQQYLQHQQQKNQLSEKTNSKTTTSTRTDGYENRERTLNQVESV